MNYSSKEIKAGMLITATLVLLFSLTFIVGNFSRTITASRKIKFGYVAGLKKDAPVYFAGHEVGRVDKIEEIDGGDQPIEVTIRIPQHLELHEDSSAFIDTLGLMGEKFVELEPGTQAKPMLRPQAIIPSVDPVRMYRLIQRVDLLTGRMEALTGTLDSLLKGNQEEISKTIANMRETSANLRDMTNDLKFHPWRLLRKG